MILFKKKLKPWCIYLKVLCYLQLLHEPDLNEKLLLTVLETSETQNLWYYGII